MQKKSPSVGALVRGRFHPTFCDLDFPRFDGVRSALRLVRSHAGAGINLSIFSTGLGNCQIGSFFWADCGAVFFYGFGYLGEEVSDHWNPVYF